MSVPETREIARIEEATLRGYAIESAEQDVAAMVDEIVDFLGGNCTGDREPSDYFGPISNAELLQIAFKLEATERQCKDAMLELRRRYLADRAGLVARLVEERQS